MSGFWKRTKGTSSHSTSATTAEEGKPVVHSRRRSKKLVIIIVGVIAVLAVGGYLLMTLRNKTDTQTTNEKDLTKIAETKDVKSVVEQYGDDKQEIAKEVRSSTSKQWDKTMLDKAYFNLIYADKTGSFTEVYTLLSLLDIAGESGVNIDDNSYGIDEADRDAMRERADTAAKQAKRKQKVPN